MIKGVRIMPFPQWERVDLSVCSKRRVLLLTMKLNEEKYPVNALIGIVIGGRQEYEAIFNPKILV